MHGQAKFSLQKVAKLAQKLPALQIIIFYVANKRVEWGPAGD